MNIAIFASLLFLPSAQADSLEVHGIKVSVSHISYYSDGKVHNFMLDMPSILPFAGGNYMQVENMVYLYTNGSISALLSEQAKKVKWLTKDGRILELDCGKKRGADGMSIGRMVTFHENREYKGGCDLQKEVLFADKAGSNILVSGSLTVDQNFHLLHAGRVGEGAVLLTGENRVQLQPGTELSYYPSGVPYFFTPALQEKIIANQGSYGFLSFQQNTGRPVVMKLMEDGTVERGILAQALAHQQTGLHLKPGTGVVFTKKESDLLITEMIFLEPTLIAAKGHQILADRFQWDLEKNFYNLIVAQNFTFHAPDGRKIAVPKGSLVGLSMDWEVVGIRIPQR